MLLAQDCRCGDHLVFETGVCFRSGRLLDAASVAPSAVTSRRQADDWTVRLMVAVIDAQHDLRERASADLGFELPLAAGEAPVAAAERDAYAAWLEARLSRPRARGVRRHV